MYVLFFAPDLCCWLVFGSFLVFFVAFVIARSVSCRVIEQLVGCNVKIS